MNLEEYTWHCIYSAPQRELATGYKLVGLGYEVIIPTEKKWQDKGRHTRVVLKPEMPRYVFTGFKQPPNWENIRINVPTAIGYMEFGRGPTALRLSDVQWLYDRREILAGRQRPTVVEDVIKVGNTVRVLHGPFTGHSFVVDKVVADRIHTIKEFLGTPRLFTFPVADLAIA